MVTRHKTARSVLWSVLESGSLTLISFGALVLFSRLLTPADFGLFSIALAFIEILSVVITMLFHDALVQREKVTERHFDTAFTFTMGLSFVMVAVCWIGAPAFSRLVHHPDAGPLLGWLSLSLPWAGFSATIIARQRRNFEFRAVALRSLAGRALGAALGLAAAFAGYGVWSLVVQQIVTATIGALVLWIMCLQKPRFGFGLRECRELLRFGIFSVCAQFLQFSITRFFTMSVGVLAGMETAGFLNIAFRTVDVLYAVAATAVSQVTLPLMARFQNDLKGLKAAYRKGLAFNCLLQYPCFIGLGLVAPDVIELLYGGRWLPSAPFVLTLSLLIILRAAKVFTNPILTALGRPHYAMAGSAVELAVIGIGLGLFHPHSGESVILIWVTRELLSVPVMSLLLWRTARLTPWDQVKGAVSPLIAVCGMAIAVIGIRHVLPESALPLVRLMASVGAGAVSYGALIYALDRRQFFDLLRFIGAGLDRSKNPATHPDA